jgi:effector-binding domain-containing protein
MLKWMLGTVLGVILGMAGYFTWYLGALRPVNLAEQEAGPYNLLYKENVGPYHKVAPLITEVETFAKSHGLICKLTFGQYLDDPRNVEEGRLRAHVGCLLSTEELAALKDLPADYKTETILSKKYLVAIFEGSPAIGPMKVYPKAEDYFNAKNIKIAGPVIEIYEVHSEKAMTTKYLFPM